MALAGFPLVPDFGDAAAEAAICRADCALFDFSFLECVRLEGDHVQGVIETLSGRSLDALGKNEICYALRSGPAGGLIADWTVWRTGADSFEVMSGRREDIDDLLACAGASVNVTDMTAQRAVFAVQGPRTLEVLRKLGSVNRIESLKYFAFDRAYLADIPCTIGRLGYTGEAGFEIIVERALAPKLWQTLLSHVRPAGFVAADMLRIEAGFILFTNEFRIAVSSREAGLEKFGRPTITLEPELSLVSFRAEADHLSWPWQPSRDLQRPAVAGSIAVTSACDSVVAGGILGLGYVLAGTAPETVVYDSMATFRNIRLTRRPFYDTAKRRPRAPWR
jgi:glycine cleavage system aminomethyltransferase T